MHFSEEQLSRKTDGKMNQCCECPCLHSWAKLYFWHLLASQHKVQLTETCQGLGFTFSTAKSQRRGVKRYPFPLLAHCLSHSPCCFSLFWMNQEERKREVLWAPWATKPKHILLEELGEDFYLLVWKFVMEVSQIAHSYPKHLKGNRIWDRTGQFSYCPSSLLKMCPI